MTKLKEKFEKILNDPITHAQYSILNEMKSLGNRVLKVDENDDERLANLYLLEGMKAVSLTSSGETVNFKLTNVGKDVLNGL